MPVVPYERNIGLTGETVRIHPPPTSPNYAGQVTRSLSQGAESLAQGVIAFGQAQLHADEKAARKAEETEFIAVDEKLNQFKLHAIDVEDQNINLSGEEALNAADNYRASLEKRMEALSKDLTDRQRQYFNKNAFATLQNGYGRLRTAGAAVQSERVSQNIKSSMDNDFVLAQRSGDLSAFTGTLARNREKLVELCKMDEATAEKTVRDLASAKLKGYFDALAGRGDYKAFHAGLEQFEGEMNPSDVEALKTSVRQLESADTIWKANAVNGKLDEPSMMRAVEADESLNQSQKAAVAQLLTARAQQFKISEANTAASRIDEQGKQIAEFKDAEKAVSYLNEQLQAHPEDAPQLNAKFAAYYPAYAENQSRIKKDRLNADRKTDNSKALLRLQNDFDSGSLGISPDETPEKLKAYLFYRATASRDQLSTGMSVYGVSPDEAESFIHDVILKNNSAFKRYASFVEQKLTGSLPEGVRGIESHPAYLSAFRKSPLLKSGKELSEKDFEVIFNQANQTVVSVPGMIWGKNEKKLGESSSALKAGTLDVSESDLSKNAYPALTQSLLNTQTSERAMIWLIYSGAVGENGELQLSKENLRDFYKYGVSGYPVPQSEKDRLLKRLKEKKIMTPEEFARVNASRYPEQEITQIFKTRMGTAEFRKNLIDWVTRNQSVNWDSHNVKTNTYIPETTFERGAILNY